MNKKRPAANKRFGVMWGVCSRKVLWEFESLSPARTPSRRPSNCLKTYLSSLRIEYLKSISDRGTNKAALKNTF